MFPDEVLAEIRTYRSFCMVSLSVVMVVAVAGFSRIDLTARDVKSSSEVRRCNDILEVMRRETEWKASGETDGMWMNREGSFLSSVE